MLESARANVAFALALDGMWMRSKNGGGKSYMRSVVMAIRKTGWFIVAVAAMVAGGAFGYVITDTTGWMLNTNTAEEAGGCTSLDNSGDNTV